MPKRRRVKRLAATRPPYASSRRDSRLHLLSQARAQPCNRLAVQLAHTRLGHAENVSDTRAPQRGHSVEQRYFSEKIGEFAQRMDEIGHRIADLEQRAEAALVAARK